MKCNVRNGLLLGLAAVIAAAAVVVYLFNARSEKKQAAVESQVAEDNGAKTMAKLPKAQNKRLTRRDLRTPLSPLNKVAKVAETKVKPDFSEEAGDDSELSEAMKAIFEELQAALDVEDKKRVISLVKKLQTMDEWPDDIPQSVKMKALDALGWFGASGIAEAVGFLADSDTEVVETAIEKFEEMLSDCDLGDVGVASILKQIVKVVHDEDALDTFFMEMNNMRPTVKAQLTLDICDSGNADAIRVLDENMEFIYGDAEVEYEIKTREDVEKYLKDSEQAYADDPEKAQDDEDFYGPPKD